VRSWSLVNRAATANRIKLLFNLHKAKSKISVFDNGDIRHDKVETIAKRLGVTGQDLIDMNGWLSGDASLNAPIRADSDSGEWLDWLVDGCRARASNRRRESIMPVRIFYAQDNKQIGELESEINKWQRSLGSKASVTHTSTAMTEHKDEDEGWQTRLAVTIWYEL
jgi:hypothetical protein